MPRIGRELLRAELGANYKLIVVGREDVSVVGDTTPARLIAYGVDHVQDVHVMGSPLYDDVEYTVYLQGPAEAKLLIGEHEQLLDWITVDGGRIGTARVTFRQVGFTTVRLPSVGAVLKVQIQPRKLDYETDYRDMIQDLEEVVRGLAARMVAQSYGESSFTDDDVDVWAYWIRVLGHLWESLEASIRYTWATLPGSLVGEQRVIDLSRKRRLTPRDVRAMHVRGHTKLLTEVRTWQDLTAERMYIMQLLAFIVKRLNEVVGVHPSPDMTALRNRAARLLGSLTGDTEVAHSKQYPAIPRTPLAQRHPGLKDIIQTHRGLNRGLFPDGGKVMAAYKDVNRLYEYWCYVKLVQVLVEESGGHLEISPRVSQTAMDIVLATSNTRPARVVTSDDRVVNVWYERRFSNLPTTAQQPDNVVRVEGQRGIVVFDAKYRFELDTWNLDNYGGGLNIPPVDSLNRMHQYKDAIVVREAHSWQRVVDMAVIVFPLPLSQHEQFTTHRFWKSIDSVGVGAVPLLPGDDQLMRLVVQRFVL